MVFKLPLMVKCLLDLLNVCDVGIVCSRFYQTLRYASDLTVSNLRVRQNFLLLNYSLWFDFEIIACVRRKKSRKVMPKFLHTKTQLANEKYI